MAATDIREVTVMVIALVIVWHHLYVNVHGELEVLISYNAAGERTEENSAFATSLSPP
jgi:hypothetical protein